MYMNWDTVQAGTSVKLDPVPAGIYKLKAAFLEPKPTKAGTGEYIKATFVVVDNKEFEGRKIFEIFNFSNPSKTAEMMGRSALKQFLMACDIKLIEAQTRGQFLGNVLTASDAIFKAKVGVTTSIDPKYGMRNNIEEYLVDVVIDDSVPF